MRIFISTFYEHIIIAPNKCGSSSVDYLFQTRRHWDNVFVGKPVNNPADILNEYIDFSLIENYKKILLVRNPFDFIISGFRFLISQKELNDGICFTDLTSHLMAIKKNIVKNDYFWLYHCQYQPADYYNPGFIIHKLEKFDNFLNYLDTYCNGDYEHEYAHYQHHKQTTVPYPSIKEFEEELIIEITKKAAKLTNYNIPKSIDVYKKHYDSGKLNELFK